MPSRRSRIKTVGEVQLVDDRPDVVVKTNGELRSETFKRILAIYRFQFRNVTIEEEEKIAKAKEWLRSIIDSWDEGCKELGLENHTTSKVDGLRNIAASNEEEINDIMQAFYPVPTEEATELEDEETAVDPEF